MPDDSLSSVRPAAQTKAMSTGIPRLDEAIGGGYPVSAITRIVLPEVRRTEVIGRLARAFDGPAFMLCTQPPPPELPENFTVTEVSSDDAWTAARELWKFLSSDHDPCLVVLDDTLLGARDTDGRLRAKWGAVLPKLRTKIRHDAFVTFSALAEEPGRLAWDGIAWAYYASITAIFEPAGDDLYVVTFRKCRFAPSQGHSVTIDLS